MFGIILLSLLWLVILELNKNTIPGWIMVLVAAVIFFIVRKRFLKGRKWFLRAASWILYLAVLCLIFVVSYPPTKAVPALFASESSASYKKHPDTTQIYTVAQGDLTGVYDEAHEVEVFAGIPYAKAPVGDLRWKAPQDPDSWNGTFVADTFGPMSMQPTNLPLYNSLTQIIGYHDYAITQDDNWVAPVSEDSLYLNIWKPAGDLTDVPVLVYIHGGSLQTGQPWYADYSGYGLAKKGVIVVNMAYRLGVYGIYGNEELASESGNGSTGNYGLMDQIKALEWVQENIQAFGGNPDNVTIAGESAGSACISALCVSPKANGLFKRAIGESSSVTAPSPEHSYRTYEDTLEAGKKFLEEHQVSTVAELRALSAEEILHGTNDNHHITVDGTVLEKSPYEYYLEGTHNEEALLEGFNKTESVPFMIMDTANASDFDERLRSVFGDYTDEIKALYPHETNEEAKASYQDIFTADWFSYGHYCWTRQALSNEIPVYEYYFTKENGRLGSWHSGEEVYCYGNIPQDSKLYDDRDRELAAQMSTYRANFCYTGDPNQGYESAGTDKHPPWPKSTDPTKILELGDTTEMTTDPFVDLYKVLDKWQGYEPAQN